MTQRIYDKFITQLQTSIREEISEIKAEGNLEAVLNALDTIVEEGKDRKEPAWRPSGIPEKDLQRTMVPYFLQQRDALQRRVQKQEAENRQLADAVLAGRRQVEELQLQGQARQQAWQAQPREYKWCWRLGEAAQLSPEQQHQHTMRPLPLLALLALATLCLAGWADAKPSRAESGRGAAFVSKQEGSEVVKRFRRYLDHWLGAPAPYPDPLEPRREVCELNPDCDELADHIGFQEAYRRFYGTA
ncbi:polyamine-modulated factor 1-like isoform X2 [Equus quagga]|nr:polyamine-modulated factor 1-like isoform X2 [Equus quagga]